MKLPPENRQMVYQYYFKNLILGLPWARLQIVLNYPIRCGCATTNLKSYKEEEAIPLKMPLIFTCSQIKDEALAVWFQERLFKFRCSCELGGCERSHEVELTDKFLRPLSSDK